MRLVFAGTPQAAVPALDALLASRHEVAAVLTRPDAPAGRGLHLVPSPVGGAGGRGRRSRCSSRPGRAIPAFLDRLRAIAPDCCPVTAYGALLPQAALERPASTAGSTCTSRCCRRGAARHRCSTPSCTGTT